MLEDLHPALWRASQLGHAATRSIETGHPALSAQLPGGGWPIGTVIELLLPQPGIGELRVVGPALATVARGNIVLIDPTHVPNQIAFSALGVAPENLIWLRGQKHADAMWAAEQVARSGTCGAVLIWANHIRTENIRRLNLAAQTGETLLYLMRPIACAQDPSPAALRLSLRPTVGGINVGFVKRRGPLREDPLFLPLSPPNVHSVRPIPLSSPVEYAGSAAGRHMLMFEREG